MKKTYNIPAFLLTLITLTGFLYCVISTLKDPTVEIWGRIIVTAICSLGLLASFIAIGHMLKTGFKKEELSEAEKDRIREEAYEEWQRTLAEAEAKCEEAREKWEEYQKTLLDVPEEPNELAEFEAETQ